jgi:hypothetical protein
MKKHEREIGLDASSWRALSRREFLANTAFVGAGLAVGMNRSEIRGSSALCVDRVPEGNVDLRAASALFPRETSRPELGATSSAAIQANPRKARKSRESRGGSNHIMAAAARDLFGAYDSFLALLDDAASRTTLNRLIPEDAGRSDLYIEARAIGHRFQGALTAIFLDDNGTALSQLTRIYGVF